MTQQPSATAPLTDLAAGLSSETVDTLAKLTGEPAWATQLRRAGWDAFQRIPMPTTKDEVWRRTDLTGLKLESVAPYAAPGYRATDPASLPEEIRKLFQDSDGRAGLVVQHNSRAVYSELSAELAAKGVIYTDLETAMREHPDLVREHLYSVVPIDDNKFTALHAALMTSGTFLYVPTGVTIETPLLSSVWADIAQLGIFNHTLVVVESGADVTLIDQLASPTLEGQAVHSGVVEIVVKQGARARYINLQEWGRQYWSFSMQRARVHRDATFNSLIVAFGGRLTRNGVETALVEPNANTEMLGLLFGDKRQHFDHHTIQDHLAPHTTSDLLYKDALTDRARSVFTGLIRAHKKAQRTDAIQTNRNLLLSDNARADSIPTLEILTNDLRCTHAATIAPIEEEQIFYLQARGMSRTEAIFLIVQGFFEPLLERITLPGVRERLRATIAEKMNVQG